MEGIEREVIDIENQILGAIERCQQYHPTTVIFVALELLERMAHDFAPIAWVPNDSLELAMGEDFDGEAESLHKVMDYAPEFQEAIRRIDAGEPVNTTAAELGLTPKELLDVIGGEL